MAKLYLDLEGMSCSCPPTWAPSTLPEWEVFPFLMMEVESVLLPPTGQWDNLEISNINH